MSNRSKRSTRGSMAAVIIAVTVLLGVIVCALGMDVFHYITAKAELQNATDAGALAGAQELWTDLNLAKADAFAVTALNQADGRSVSSTAPATSVAVAVQAPSVNQYGTVQVDASMQIRHFIAAIFGRPTDIIRATSVAGTTGTLQQLFADQAFPLAVSYDTIPSSGIPLNQASIGGQFSLFINSQQVKNAAFTSFTVQPASASYVQSAVEQALGLSPIKPGFIPAIQIGDNINLINGVAGQKKLGNGAEYAALTQPSRPPLVLPVISGDPAFNKNAPVVGFVSLRVTSVTLDSSGGTVETITGILQHMQVNGQSSGGGGSTVAAASKLLPGPVQLIR